ncbi:MAG: zf-HC2 domain-containing protein [Prolixibacteraceae bacterium]|jgi:hypothetical protein|nr:zf-HC2 domain-containing protein [Prolixibacteraceae bacterium]MBT6004295.1 zf-HC2 domain-containing protein [Prolixibacteraceae bacterium]MBT6767330.1 zf-HC2 domain-containing protein [Prolixibacteraceae bacterium]MBT7000128.1 zf-HC2 domain-containing protein [Prolixibacteraceae bacterium]MBT7397336.1 zf-HC2 domain-containing protein [Prolixibacteraceae bacterium]
MKCKTLHKDLIFFLEKELPEKEMELVKTHLAECSNCALFAEEMKKTLGILEAERSPAVNPFFYTRLKAKIENREPEIKQVFWKPELVRVLQPVLFSVLLILGIYTGIKIGQPTPAQMISVNAADQEIISFLNEMDSEPIEGFLME